MRYLRPNPRRPFILLLGARGSTCFRKRSIHERVEANMANGVLMASRRCGVIRGLHWEQKPYVTAGGRTGSGTATIHVFNTTRAEADKIFAVDREMEPPQQAEAELPRPGWTSAAAGKTVGGQRSITGAGKMLYMFWEKGFDGSKPTLRDFRATICDADDVEDLPSLASHEFVEKAEMAIQLRGLVKSTYLSSFLDYAGAMMTRSVASRMEPRPDSAGWEYASATWAATRTRSWSRARRAGWRRSALQGWE